MRIEAEERATPITPSVTVPIFRPSSFSRKIFILYIYSPLVAILKYLGVVIWGFHQSEHHKNGSTNAD